MTTATDGYERNYYGQRIIPPELFDGAHIAADVPAAAGLPPVCSCGWTRWFDGERWFELWEHLRDMADPADQTPATEPPSGAAGPRRELTYPRILARDATGLSGDLAITDTTYEGQPVLVVDVGNGCEDGRVGLSPEAAAVVAANLLEWAYLHLPRP